MNALQALQAKSRTLLLALACWLAIAMVGGCSGKKDDKDKDGGGPGDDSKPTAEVSGTVTLPDGKPLPAGWIAFHGKDAAEAAMAPIDGGQFLARGVPVGGSIRVTVDVDLINADAVALDQQILEMMVRTSLMKGAGKADADLDKRMEDMKDRRKKLGELQKALKGITVDRKFALPETTPLTNQKISSGAQKIDIKLQ
jgi:hypothetical protein